MQAATALLFQRDADVIVIRVLFTHVCLPTSQDRNRQLFLAISSS